MFVAPRLVGKCPPPPEEEEEEDDELASEGSISMADEGQGEGGAKTTGIAINNGTPLKGASGSNYLAKVETKKDQQKNMYTRIRAQPIMNMESRA